MSADPAIRRAMASDIDVIAALRRRMFEDMGDFDAGALDATTPAFIAYATRALPAGDYIGWLAEAGTECVGTAGIIPQQLPPHPRNLHAPVGYLLNVFVDPDWRRRGLATRLAETAVAHCRSAGFGAVVLHASEAGEDIYRRLGFERTNEMRLFLAPLAPKHP